MPSAGVFPASRTAIAGVGIAELAGQFGTPTFIYDAAVIVERIQDLRAFDLVRYAQKACSNIAVLDLVRLAVGETVILLHPPLPLAGGCSNGGSEGTSAK